PKKEKRSKLSPLILFFLLCNLATNCSLKRSNWLSLSICCKSSVSCLKETEGFDTAIIWVLPFIALYKCTASYILKLSLPISSHKRVARPIICSYRILDFTARKKTRLQIAGTSIPVVNKSTVTTILGYFSFLNFLVSSAGSFILPVIFVMAS